MDDDLIQRLLLAESDFLDALQNGPQMLASYRQTLSVLPDLFSTAMKTGNVGPGTSSLAHSVASRISKIASCFLDINNREKLTSAQLQSDCDTIVRQMGALDLNTRPKSPHLDDTSNTPCHPVFSNASTPSAECSSPPFLTSAYQWFLENLHNPYPTAEIKARIAAASSCQISSVSSWFVNARRRVGWMSVCREHFSNCRTDMMDAAYRALVEEDPQRMLSPELRHRFIAMKVAAEGLYPSTCTTKSAFRGGRDAIVKDPTEESWASFEVEKYCEVEQANLGKMVRDSYPSPDRSSTTSPVPALDGSLTDESEEEEDASPPIVAGSKRRRSSIEPVNQPTSIRRPNKRLRTSATSQTYLPSPSSSIDDIDVPLDHCLPELHSAHSTLPGTDEVLPSRKRRRFDAGITWFPKRPQGSVAASHLHTVPDPLPRSNMENEYSIDDWFNANFDDLFAIPPPVDAAEPDFSASWEVELFRNYSIPGNPKCAPKCPSAPADTHTPAVSASSGFDSLLQSITGDKFFTASESVLPSNISGAPYIASLNSSIPDISHIDWTSLLNGPDTCQSTTHSTLLQYPTDAHPLPEIDLSMLQLPHVTPLVNSQQGDLASKQVKLHQLHAMQEAVRQMEQELQSEGVVI